jgi:hypothetical protein
VALRLASAPLRPSTATVSASPPVLPVVFCIWCACVGAWSPPSPRSSNARSALLLLAPPIAAPPSPRSSNARSRGRAWGCETPRAPFFLRSSRWSLPRWRRRAWIDSRRATSSPLLGARGRQRRGIQIQHHPAPYLPSAPLPLDRDGGEARTPRGGGSNRPARRLAGPILSRWSATRRELVQSRSFIKGSFKKKSFIEKAGRPKFVYPPIPTPESIF